MADLRLTNGGFCCIISPNAKKYLSEYWRKDMKRAYLVLADGSVFGGFRFGSERDTVGELVFTTGMCGYTETLTDPSYSGQIVMQTYPLIGNYGIMESDFEGSCSVRGYVVRERCDRPSNFRMQTDLDTFLKQRDIPWMRYGVGGHLQAQHSGWPAGASPGTAKRGCEVTVLPAIPRRRTILAMDPDGVMLSNGPGDPAEDVGAD
jgi:carbamoylphosphate synthase small subunit